MGSDAFHVKRGKESGLCGVIFFCESSVFRNEPAFTSFVLFK
jgi:hypothetical protein